MRYAIDLHTTEDWGGAPTYQSSYIYDSAEQALNDGVELLHRWAAANTPLEHLGVDVVSEQRDGNDEPVYEELFTPRSLGWMG